MVHVHKVQNKKAGKLWYSKEDVRNAVEVCARIPGRDWWKCFLRRWPCLSECKPQHLSKKRAKASHPEIINGWFDLVEELARSVSLDFSDPATAQHLGSCDETGLCTAAGAESPLVK